MIAILSAMDVEIDLLKCEMQNPKVEEHLKNNFTKGKISGHEVVLAASSIGKVNAAITAQFVINNYKPDIILHTGIAGALAPYVEELTLCLGERITYHDFSPTIMDNFMPFQRYFYSDAKLMQIAEDYLKENEVPYEKGLIATGDSFVETREQKYAIRQKMPALCVDMESAAIACAAFVNRVPILVVRTISDLADEDSHTSYEKNEQVAADISANLVLEIIKRM
ncbi:MAG: 5'-methylthioadenosine/adenosylhomocysteine nucleosidase [Christensenellaceae bacterium]|nr:5'-methylthioadenosine/adenosylhomocysteine nucleosidase [Christensenellaceae bacterium]